MIRPVARPGLVLAPLSLAISHPATAFAQRIGQGGGVEIAWWRALAGLILCLFLAVLGALALRARTGGGWTFRPPAGLGEVIALLRGGATSGRAAPRLRLVERLRLNPQLEVCLVACDEREILLAATPQGAVVLADNDRRPPA